MEETLECLFCHDVVQIPVSLLFSCFNQGTKSCTCLICLRCARDFFQLNQDRNTRIYSVNCPICKNNPIKLENLNAKGAYKINFELMKLMDTMKITAANKCHQCETDCQSQSGLYRHIRNGHFEWSRSRRR